MKPQDVRATKVFEKAMALLSLGVPPVNVAGKLVKPGDCWEFRLISSSELEKHGCETIEDAEEMGIEGEIAYGFGPHKDRDRISAAFDKALTIANRNQDVDVPDVIEVTDAKGKKTQVNAAEVIAMGIAFAFRNAEKWYPRRTQVQAKLKLDGDGQSFGIIDRKSSPEEVEHIVNSLQ